MAAPEMTPELLSLIRSTALRLRGEPESDALLNAMRGTAARVGRPSPPGYTGAVARAIGSQVGAPPAAQGAGFTPAVGQAIGGLVGTAPQQPGAGPFTPEMLQAILRLFGTRGVPGGLLGAYQRGIGTAGVGSEGGPGGLLGAYQRGIGDAGIGTAVPGTGAPATFDPNRMGGWWGR